MKFDYINPANGKKCTVESDKKLIMIYGKNGSGKTSISRNEHFESKVVFNQDFINKNVFITDENGAVMSSDTKRNFSGLWVGENIVSIAQEIQRLEEILRIQETDKKTIIKETESKVRIFDEGFKIVESEYFDEWFSVVDENIDEAREVYVVNSPLITDIESEDDYCRSLKILQNKSFYTVLINLISSNTLLKELIISNSENELNRVNALFERYYSLKTEVEMVFEKFESVEVDRVRIIPTIMHWLELHELKTDCIFCGNADIEDQIAKWKEVVNSESSKIRLELEKLIGSNIKTCEEIIIHEDEFSKIANQTVLEIKSLKTLLEVALANMLDNELAHIDYKSKESIVELKSTLDIIENMRNYVLKSYYRDLVFLISNNKKIKNELNNQKILLQDAMNANAANLSEGINTILIKLGLDQKLNITVNNRTKPSTFEYNLPDGRKISTMSEGEKHKMALAVFLYSLKSIDYSNAIIVLDDPVSTLDVVGYHLLKSYIIKEIVHEISANDYQTRILILTHDINYLFIQLSNVFDNEGLRSITGIYKINEDDLQNIDIDLLRSDDLTLFKIALDHVGNIKDLLLFPHLILKVFRHLIDIKNRTNGVIEIVGIGISNLPLEENKRERIQEISNKFSEKLKDNVVDNPEDIVEYFVLLKEASELLDFNGFVADKDLEKVVDALGNHSDYLSTHPCFDVLQQISTFMEKSENEDIKRYIRHPRNSFTKNMVTLYLDDDTAI